MVTTPEKIAQMELALAQARAEYERENGKRFEIIMREISPDEKQRILDSLTDRQERILFGLEVAVERVRPGKSGGDLTCPHCGKAGLTERGLKLHITRVHPESREETPQAASLFGAEEVKSPRRRGARAQEDEEIEAE
jgi:hypothetical protein